MIFTDDPQTGRPVPYVVTRRDTDHFYQTGRAMLRAGLSIPVPLEHQPVKPMTAAERSAHRVLHNAGWVDDFRRDSAGRLSAALNIPDAELARRLPTTIKFVSPEIDPSFRDGDGQHWTNAITHVALTLRPRWAHQAPFGAPSSPAPVEHALPPVRYSLTKSPVRLSLAGAVRRVKAGWAPVYPTQLSHESRGANMAEDTDTTLAAAPEGETAPPETEGDSDAALIAEASQEAAELGIMVPEDAGSCDEWVRHFITAVKSHKATKGQGEEAATGGGAAVTEESQPAMLMSLATIKDPAVRALYQEREESIRSRRTEDLNYLAARTDFIPKAEVERLKAKVGPVRFSLSKAGRFEAEPIDEELGLLVRLAKSHKSPLTHQLALTGVTEEPKPVDGDRKKQEEAGDELAERATRTTGKRSA